MPTFPAPHAQPAFENSRFTTETRRLGAIFALQATPCQGRCPRKSEIGDTSFDWLAGQLPRSPISDLHGQFAGGGSRLRPDLRRESGLRRATGGGNSYETIHLIPNAYAPTSCLPYTTLSQLSHLFFLPSNCRANSGLSRTCFGTDPNSCDLSSASPRLRGEFPLPFGTLLY